MSDASKLYEAQKENFARWEILKDISLSFFPGAKIGVIGANGSGKSSLLRIMAGRDSDYSGEARLTPSRPEWFKRPES